MKLNCRKLLQNTQKRYVYETLPTHEQDVPPVVNPNPDTTLDKVKSVIEGSYGQLLTMKGKFDSLLETISKEKTEWQAKIDELRGQLEKDKTLSQTEGSIMAFGKEVTIIVNSAGAQETFVDGKPMEEGFYKWALNQKQNQTEGKDKQINA